MKLIFENVIMHKVSRRKHKIRTILSLISRAPGYVIANPVEVCTMWYSCICTLNIVREDMSYYSTTRRCQNDICIILRGFFCSC